MTFGGISLKCPIECVCKACKAPPQEICVWYKTFCIPQHWRERKVKSGFKFLPKFPSQCVSMYFLQILTLKEKQCMATVYKCWYVSTGRINPKKLCIIIHQQYGVGKRPVLASLRTLSCHNVTSPSLAAQYICNGFEMDLQWIWNGWKTNRRTNATRQKICRSVYLYDWLSRYAILQSSS